MKRFFVALNQIKTKSLKLTNEVLRERQELEVSVENLQKQVKVGLVKLEEIRETREIVKKHEAEISRNEKFEFEVTVTKPVQEDISGSGNGTMEVAALGRPFSLGMLYDCRKDSLIPGMTLWDREDLIKHVAERPQNYNDFEIVASESIEDKSSALNVEAPLKASFLSGLVEVGGSAKYLNDSKTSSNQARVTLKYKATTKVQELSMDQLGNVKHPYVFDKGLATHVVTAVLYGAQAFFVFDREVSENESHQDIQGNLKVLIEKIPSLKIEGEGSLKMEDKDTAKVEKFVCKFHGDFSLQKPPTSYQDAVEVYQSLPKLLGANGENAVPVKVWLLPLTSLDSSAAKLVRQISIGLVQEAQRVLEDFSELEMRCNDALRTTTAQQFTQIGKKIQTFKDMCSEFKMEFQRTLAKKLPSIRGGGEEEAVLAEILKKRHSSPFNSENLNEWMDCKDREIYTVKSYTNMMKNTKIVPSQNHLHREILSTEQVVCFIFTSLGSPEPYLSAVSDYLRGKTEPDHPQDPHTRDVEKEQWYASKEVADTMRQKANVTVNVCTTKKEKLSDAVKEKSKQLQPKTGPLPVYRIPLKDEHISVSGCRRFSFGKESFKPNRTIMVLGATGAGKS
uniref:SNTX thioredoxin-like domain-containing protein n=1 Tax=Anabas testudineus TaxID=64144 RepID=A0A7N6FCS1_ANATE